MMDVSTASLRVYNVGFGDCFLLKLTYDDAQHTTRCVLFDFGSTRLPARSDPGHMARIANDIRTECGGKLALVVATHRHADHISGFGDAVTGPIIQQLAPDLVVQPWTEEPSLAVDADQPVAGPPDAGQLSLTRNLANMQAFAAGARQEGLRFAGLAGFPAALADRLTYLGDTNITNRSAVEALMNLGAERVYARFGDIVDVTAVLPGVDIEVLGPPTLREAPSIAKQTRSDADEFWHLAAGWGRAVADGTARAEDIGPQLTPIFAEPHRADAIPQAAKWLVPQLSRTYANELLSLVRIIDKTLNNTSLILLVRIGDTRLLFPGDAQIENWSYALFDAPGHARIRAELARTNLYKVGHHGSLNATPKTLWNGFGNRQELSAKDRTRLISVLSTRSGTHGDPWRGTEVPRGPLVDELDRWSTLHHSGKWRGTTKPWRDVQIPLVRA